MSLENSIRLMAGVMIAVSLTLYYLVSPYWLLLAVFVSLNLIQSSFMSVHRVSGRVTRHYVTTSSIGGTTRRYRGVAPDGPVEST